MSSPPPGRGCLGFRWSVRLDFLHCHSTAELTSNPVSMHCHDVVAKSVSGQDRGSQCEAAAIEAELMMSAGSMACQPSRDRAGQSSPFHSTCMAHAVTLRFQKHTHMCANASTATTTAANHACARTHEPSPAPSQPALTPAPTQHHITPHHDRRSWPRESALHGNLRGSDSGLLRCDRQPLQSSTLPQASAPS